MTPLAAALRDQSDRLTRLAHHLADQGHASLAACITVHAAELAAHETTARRLEAEARTADAVATGLRVALRQARATAEHLQAELIEEADLSEAAIDRRHRYARIIAAIPLPPMGPGRPCDGPPG